jgi:hypothetical protein
MIIRKYNLDAIARLSSPDLQKSQLERFHADFARYGDCLQALFDEVDTFGSDLAGRDMALPMLQTGNWYFALDEEESAHDAVFVGPITGSRNARVLTLGTVPGVLKKAVTDAINDGYRKIVAVVPIGSSALRPLYRAGFQRVGQSPREGLINGMWVDMVTLELLSPQWEEPAGEVVVDGNSWRGADGKWDGISAADSVSPAAATGAATDTGRWYSAAIAGALRWLGLKRADASASTEDRAANDYGDATSRVDAALEPAVCVGEPGPVSGTERLHGTRREPGIVANGRGSYAPRYGQLDVWSDAT